MDSDSWWTLLTPQQAQKLLKRSLPALHAGVSDATGTATPLPRRRVVIATPAGAEPRPEHAGTDPFVISYGSHATPFGQALVAASPLGLCHLDFFDDDGAKAISELQRRWPRLPVRAEPQVTAPLVRQLFDPPQTGTTLALHLQGTPFQYRVWQVLLRIPCGCLATYAGVAGAIGQPRAARAVGHAISQNPICYIVPCHRVVRADGTPGGYRSGLRRKQALLATEINPHEQCR
jgi:AraC family transcriptional regulator of adaptative response/methylated-DNA-[protein]-cysteine methyltransferase